MKRAGYELDASWFAPHFEFRFPLYGTVRFGAIEIELRQALEPWHVLGEEGAVGGTVRYVDSSVERLQVKVRGLTDGRYVIACNGWRVPLTGDGPRRRARRRRALSRLETGLEPASDDPRSMRRLTFDLYDRWSGRAVAGCTYHVAHPGGRNFERVPRERLRSGEPPARALLPVRPHGRPLSRAAAAHAQRVPEHTRSALVPLSRIDDGQASNSKVMSAINSSKERRRFRRSQVARVLPAFPACVRRADERRRPGAAALAAGARSRSPRWAARRRRRRKTKRSGCSSRTT